MNKIFKNEQVNTIDVIQQPLQFNDQKQITHNILGVENGDKGRYKDAFYEFTKAIELNPKDANAYFNRATLKVQLGDIKGASSDFKMSEKCHHDSGFKFLNYPLL
ncbi:MAG TPA: tetratricopeptide repeat protein [Ignavibacteriaceae bacterium]|nr:tetratricopeptide repeat protein [Ignavibacteriaceae bacterium]